MFGTETTSNTTIQFNTLGSNVDCSGTLHGTCSTLGRPPVPGEGPLGPGALQCPLAMNAIGNRHWLAARVSCSNSAVDRSILQARSRPRRNSSLLRTIRARLCQRPGHRQSACEAKGETPAFPVTTKAGSVVVVGGAHTTAFAPSRRGEPADGELGSHPDRAHHAGHVSRD